MIDDQVWHLMQRGIHPKQKGIAVFGWRLSSPNTPLIRCDWNRNDHVDEVFVVLVRYLFDGVIHRYRPTWQTVRRNVESSVLVTHIVGFAPM